MKHPALWGPHFQLVLSIKMPVSSQNLNVCSRDAWFVKAMMLSWNITRTCRFVFCAYSTFLVKRVKCPFEPLCYIEQRRELYRLQQLKTADGKPINMSSGGVSCCQALWWCDIPTRFQSSISCELSLNFPWELNENWMRIQIQRFISHSILTQLLLNPQNLQWELLFCKCELQRQHKIFEFTRLTELAKDTLIKKSVVLQFRE